jgi:hypothetical protein
VVRIFDLLAVILGGGALGMLDLYAGVKLRRRYQPHRKSEEIQAVFSRNDLD